MPIRFSRLPIKATIALLFSSLIPTCYGQVAEPELASATRSETADSIDDELRFQKAIADSLRGDSLRAVSGLRSPDEEDTPALFAGAMWLMEQEEIEKGVRLLELIAGRADAPPEVDKFLAVGYLHLNDPQKSEAAVNDYLSDPSHHDDRYAHFVKGLAILHQDQPDEAAGSLRTAGYDDTQVAKIQQVVMQVPVDVNQRQLTINDPRSRMQQGSRQGRRQQPQQCPKSYNFTLLLGHEYDSNVPLQPEFSGLGSGNDLTDNRFLMASFLDLQLYSEELFSIGLLGSTYNTFQSNLDDFDIGDYMGGAYANALLLNDLVGSVRYEYHTTDVDDDKFSSEHRLTPSLSWLGSRGHTTVFYEFDALNSRAPMLIAAQNQSADINRVGLTQAVYTSGGDGRLYVGYQYADADAIGSDFDRTSHSVTGRIEKPLGHGVIADLDTRFTWDNYDSPNSLDFYERARDDDRLEVRAGLQKNFESCMSLRLDYTYIKNDSNTKNLFDVHFYEYDRHIISTQLIFTL